MNAKELIQIAQPLVESGVKNKEEFQTALPLIYQLQDAEVRLSTVLNGLKSARLALERGSSTYAEDHVSVFTVPLSEAKDGIRSGICEVDDVQYRLTISLDSPVRLDCGNLTQSFLESLPKSLTYNRLSLNVSALKGATDGQMAEWGLCRRVKRVWSKVS